MAASILFLGPKQALTQLGCTAISEKSWKKIPNNYFDPRNARFPGGKPGSRHWPGPAFLEYQRRCLSSPMEAHYVAQCGFYIARCGSMPGGLYGTDARQIEVM